MNNEKKNTFLESDILFGYSREQAIADGVLVDVSERAKEAGIQYPVAVTRALWEDIRNIPLSKSYQDVDGRLWDVLWMGCRAVRNSKEAGPPCAIRSSSSWAIASSTP